MLYKEDWEGAQRRLPAGGTARSSTAPPSGPTPRGKSRSRPRKPPEVSAVEVRTDPEAVVARNEYHFAHAWFGGEAFPYLFVNLGPGVAGTYLGGEAGKGIVFSVAAKDVPRALRELRPEGLLMKVRCGSEEEGRDLLRYTESRGSGRWTSRET